MRRPTAPGRLRLLPSHLRTARRCPRPPLPLEAPSPALLLLARPDLLATVKVQFFVFKNFCIKFE
jgi:hypothetical protein